MGGRYQGKGKIIFYDSTDLQETLAYLKEREVQYIMVDQQMRDGEIWLLD